MTDKKILLLLKLVNEGDDERLLALLLKEKPSALLKMLTDVRVPDDQRVELLHRINLQHPDMARELARSILAMAGSDQNKELTAKSARLQEMLEALEAGPLRFGRYVRMLVRDGAVPRAEVVLHDGTSAYAPVPDEGLVKQLCPGDGVLLDSQAHAVIGRDTQPRRTGEQATLERRLDDNRVLVTLSHDERRVMHASQTLMDKLADGEVEPGAALLISSQQGFAFDALPTNDALAHFRFLDRRPVPASVEMGCPPRYIDRFLKHATIALHRPELLSRWRQSLARFVLLEGVTGSGKTLSVNLLWHRMVELVSSITGVPADQLPPRVFRLRPSEVYEKWLGASDRNLATFFKEVEQMAARPFVSPVDGKVYDRIPTIAVIEELDGVARARGQGDPIYDRILTTLLQFLDQTRPEVSNSLVFWVATTNLIRQVDTAAVRRVGAQIEKMGHLSRSAFLSALECHLQSLPFAADAGGEDPGQARKAANTRIANWIYCRNGEDEGQVKMTYANRDPKVKYRRHFMTGALIARAVAEAKDRSCIQEFDDGRHVVLTCEILMEAFDRQIRATVDHLSRENAETLIEIEEGAHVSGVQPIRQPSIRPYQLRSAS